MRKTKRVVSLFITVAMMLTMVLPMTVSAAFSDVPSSHHYYDAITNLSSEGILNGFEDGTFKPEDPVTRAQFTKIICYALSVGNLTYSEEERSIFTDLAPEHWAANNIVTAYKQGIINGMGDGTFAPEAGVQYEQAVKMVVCALGYSQTRAESLGGYPGGYMSLANQAKILKNITDAKMYEVMNRGAVAQLIDNMLDADQIQDGQPGGSIREEVSTSKKVEGQVVAGYGVALYPDAELEACRKNEILISLGNTNIPYDISEINDFDIYEYLGRSVTIYYEEESGVTVDVASSIALQPRKNETTKIDLDMIYYYDASSIEYYTNEDRTETETVSYQADADVIWNGQPASDNLQTLLDAHGTKAGYITLVSSQTNQSADVVFLKTYDTMVVQSVDTKNYKVFGKNILTSGIVLDVTDRTKNVTIKSNGSDYALSSIRENHVLSISQSADSKVIEVLVSTKSASGTIEFMTNSPETQIKLNTGNTIYTVSSDVYDGGAEPMTTGMYVTVTLDAFGKVARYVPAAEATYNYGYIASLEEQGSSSNPEIWVMIYKPQASNSTLTGEIIKFADKVKIDGTNYNVTKDVDDVKTVLSTAAAKSANTGFASELLIDPETGDPINAPHVDYPYSQPVKFAVKNNEIVGIITNETTGNPATSLNIVNKVGTDGIECKVDATTFDQYRISSSTPVLYVPQNRETGTYLSKTNNFFNEGEKYYVQFANVSGTNVVSCVYVYGVVDSGAGSTAESITEENKPLIVTEANVSKLHMGTQTPYIKVMDVTTGDEIECFEETVDLSALAVGDVVRVAIGADDYVEELEILADASGVVAGTFNYATDVYEKIDGSGTGVNAEFRVIIGTVKYKEGSTFVAVPGYDTTVAETLEESYTVSEGIPVYKIDTTAVIETNIVNSSSVGEILGNANQHSKVMVYTTEGTLNAVVIFE